MSHHRFQIAYCDVVAERQPTVLADLVQARGQVQVVDDITQVPAEADVALVGVEDLKTALPTLAWLAEERPNRQLLLLWEGADQELLIAAMRAGVRDVIPSAAAVSEAVQRAWGRLAAQGGSAAERPGRVVSIFSLKGGIGKSTLGANLPIALHRASRLPTTAVDLSLPCGNLEMYLDLQPARCVGDVLAVGSDLDAGLVRQALVKHSSGISLLAGPRPGSLEALAEHSARPLLSALTDAPGVVVVDVGSYLEEAQVTALEASDVIVVPLTPLISSVGTMPAIWEYLAELGISEERVLPVLNHATADAEKVPKDVIDRLLRGRPFHELVHGGPDVGRSLNEGLPLAQHLPKNPLARSLDGLAAQVLVQLGLADATTVHLTPQATRQNWFRALFQQKGVAHVRP